MRALRSAVAYTLGMVGLKLWGAACAMLPWEEREAYYSKLRNEILTKTEGGSEVNRDERNQARKRLRESKGWRDFWLAARLISWVYVSLWLAVVICSRWWPHGGWPAAWTCAVVCAPACAYAWKKWPR